MSFYLDLYSCTFMIIFLEAEFVWQRNALSKTSEKIKLHFRTFLTTYTTLRKRQMFFISFPTLDIIFHFPPCQFNGGIWESHIDLHFLNYLWCQIFFLMIISIYISTLVNYLFVSFAIFLLIHSFLFIFKSSLKY